MGRHRKYTPDALNKAINDYFAACDGKTVQAGKDKVLSHIPYTIAGLCFHIDLSAQAFSEYAADSEYGDIIKKVRQRIESDILENGSSGLYNPIMCIFRLKCNFGYKDKTDVEISIAPRLNDSELNERIAALMVKAAHDKALQITDAAVKNTDDIDQ